jgi:TonB family protein
MRAQLLIIFLIILASCAHRQQSAGLVRLEDLDKKPMAIAQPKAEYIEVWKSARIQPTAIVLFTIQEDGSVADVALVKATRPEAGTVAVASVKMWKFEPPTYHGRPARVLIKTEVSFDFEDTTFINSEEKKK